MSALCNSFNLVLAVAVMHLCHLAQYNVHYSDGLWRGSQSIMHSWPAIDRSSRCCIKSIKAGSNGCKALALLFYWTKKMHISTSTCWRFKTAVCGKPDPIQTPHPQHLPSRSVLEQDTEPHKLWSCCSVAEPKLWPRFSKNKPTGSHAGQNQSSS